MMRDADARRLLRGLNIDMDEPDAAMVSVLDRDTGIEWGPWIIQADGSTGQRALALDGPLNGQYATAAEAQAAGYTLDRWPNREPVWVQAPLDTERESARAVFDWQVAGI